MAKGGGAYGELVLKFTSDIADILTNTERLKKDIEGYGSKVNKEIEGVKTAFKTITTVFGIYETLKHTIVSSVEAFAEVEAAQIRLQATLDATGNKAQTSVARIKSFADELSGVTTFSDDEIINAAANLAKYTQIQGDSFERTIRDAANLAAITGGPLSEAANTLGRAMENAFAASRLRRVGLLTDAEVELQKALHDAGLEAERQEALLAAIEARSAGAAAAVGGQGLTSAFTQFKNAVNNLQEELGEYISKAADVEGITRSITAAIRELIESGTLARWALEISLQFTIFKEKLIEAGKGVATLIAVFVALADVFVIVGKAAQGGSQQIAGALLILSGNVEAGMASIRQGSDLINTIPKDFEKLTADLKVVGVAWDGFWNDRTNAESKAIQAQLAELDKAGPEYAAKAKALASGIGSAPTNKAGFTEQQQAVANMVASLDAVSPAASGAAEALGDAAEAGDKVGAGVDGVRNLAGALRDAEGPAVSLADAMNKIHEEEIKADAAAVKLASGGIKAFDEFQKKAKGFSGTLGELTSAYHNSENAAKALDKRAGELGITVDTLIKRIASVQAAPQIAQSFAQQLKLMEDAHRTTLTNIEAESAARQAEIGSQLKEIQFLKDARIIGEEEFLRRRSELAVEAAQKDYDAELAKQQDLIKKIGELQAAAARAPDKDKRAEVLGQVRAAQDALTKSNADLYAKTLALDDATQEWGRNATIAAVKVADEIRKIGDEYSRTIAGLDDMIEGQQRITAQIGLTREQVAGLSAEYEVTRKAKDTLLELEKKYVEAVGQGRTLETALKPEAAQALKAYIEQLAKIAPEYANAARAAAEFNERATAALNNQVTAWQSVLDEAEAVFNTILDGGKNTFQQLANYIQTTLRKALFDLVAKQWIIPIITQISGGAVGGALNERTNTSLAQNPLARLFGYAPTEENIKNLAVSAGRASIALTAFANQLPTVLVGAVNRVVPANEIATALGSAESTFERMASDTSSIADSTRAIITDAARATTSSIADLTSSVGGFTGTLSTQVAAVGSAIESSSASAKSTIEAVATSSEQTFSDMARNTEGVMSSVASDVRTLANAVLQGAQRAFAAAGSSNNDLFGAAGLGGTITDSTRSILTDIASDNLAVTQNIAADISESTNNIIGNTTSFFQDTTGTMTDGFNSLTSSTTETFRGLTGATLNLFGGLGQTLVSLFGSLGSGISGLLGGGGGGGGGLLGSLFGGGGGNSLLGSIATSVFGAGPFASAAGAGFSAGLSTIGIAFEAGAGAVGGFSAVLGAASAVIAPLIPVFALALPLLKGLFDRPHGPKSGGFAESGNFTGLAPGERYFTPNDADKQAGDVVKGISTSIREANVVLGGRIKDLGVGFGYDIDKLGTAQSRVSAGVSIGGQSVFSQRDVEVGRSDQELQAGIETQAARAVLAAVQNSNLPTYLANILDTVVAETATKDQATAIIQTAEAAKTLVDTLSKALSPEQVARFNEALLQIDFSQAVNPIKAVVSAGFAELAPAFTPIIEAFQGTDEEITKFAATLVSIAVVSKDFSEEFKNTITTALEDATQETADKVAAFVTIFTQFGDALTGLGEQLQGLDAAGLTEFIDALGGADKAVEKIGFIYQNFTTSAEKLAYNTQKLTNDFNALGVNTIPKTHEEFLNLLASIDVTTEAGKALYNSIADLAPLFITVAGTADQAAQQLAGLAQKGRDLFTEKFLTPQEQVKQRQVVSSTELYNLTKEGTLANQVLHELGYNVVPTTTASVRALVTATIAKYGANSKEADAIYACLPAIADLIDSVNGFAAAAAATSVSVKSLVDAGHAASQSLLASYKTLVDASTGDFGAKLSLQIGLIQSSIDALPSYVRAGGGTLDQKTYFKDLQESSSKLRDQLQRFTVLSEEFDAARAEQLVSLQDWYSAQIKIFGGANADRLASLAKQKTALEALIPTTDEANIADLQSRIKQINTSIASLGVNVPALDALKVLFDQKWAAIVKGTSDAGDGVGNALDNIAKQIREFIANLLTSDLSILTPTQKLTAAQQAYNAQLALAQGGNQEALQSITKYANDYLTQARNVFASSAAYADIFNSVVGALDSLADSAEANTLTLNSAGAITPPDTTPVADASAAINSAVSTTANAGVASADAFSRLNTSISDVPSSATAAATALQTLPDPLNSVAAASTTLSASMTRMLSSMSLASSSVISNSSLAFSALSDTGAAVSNLTSLSDATTSAGTGLTTVQAALDSGTESALSAAAAATSVSEQMLVTTSSLQASAAAFAPILTSVSETAAAIDSLTTPLNVVEGESADLAESVTEMSAALASAATSTSANADDSSAALTQASLKFRALEESAAAAGSGTTAALEDVVGSLQLMQLAVADADTTTRSTATAIAELPGVLEPLPESISGVLESVITGVQESLQSAVTTAPAVSPNLLATADALDKLAASGAGIESLSGLPITFENVAAAVDSLVVPSGTAAEEADTLSGALGRLLSLFSTSATEIATGAQASTVPLSSIANALEELRSAAEGTTDATYDTATAVSGLPASLIPLAGSVSSVLEGTQEAVRSAIEAATPTVPSDLATTQSAFASLAEGGRTTSTVTTGLQSALTRLGATASGTARIHLLAALQADGLGTSVNRLLGAFSAVATSVAEGTGEISAPLSVISETLATLRDSAVGASTAAEAVTSSLSAVPSALTPIAAAVAGLTGPLSAGVRAAIASALQSADTPAAPLAVVSATAQALNELAASGEGVQAAAPAFRSWLTNFISLSDAARDELDRNASSAVALRRQGTQGGFTSNSILDNAGTLAPALQPPTGTGQVQANDVLQLREALMSKLSEATRVISESVLAGAQQARTDAQREIEAERITTQMLIEGFQTASKPK